MVSRVFARLYVQKVEDAITNLETLIESLGAIGKIKNEMGQLKDVKSEGYSVLDELDKFEYDIKKEGQIIEKNKSKNAGYNSLNTILRPPKLPPQNIQSKKTAGKVPTKPPNFNLPAKKLTYLKNPTPSG